VTDKWLGTMLEALVFAVVLGAAVVIAAGNGGLTRLQGLLVAVAVVFFALGSGRHKRPWR